LDFSKHLAKADEALRRRNYDFAVDLYRQLLDLDADLEEARRGLRQAVSKRFETKGGSKVLRAIGGAVPLGRAKAMVKVGKHDAAARAFEDYLAKQPLDPEANLALGMALEAAGHLRSAKVVYEFVAEIDPKNPEGLKRAGAMMAAGGEPERALAYYERALAADPRDQDALKARKNLAAETALSGTRLDSVSHSRELAVDPEAQAKLERSRRKTFTPEELEAERGRLEERFAEDPSDVDLMLELARVHEKLGDLDAALELVERAKSYRRDDAELAARAGLLGSKVRKRRIAEASKSGDEALADRLEEELLAFEIQDLEARIALRPGAYELQLDLAGLQQSVGDPRLALEASLIKAQAFERKAFPDLAAKEYERALAELPPADGRRKEILYTLGSLALDQGERERARERFAQVFELDISYRDVARRMEELRSPPA
jgi:tetratricopeptide (TPR) repeat protein